MLLLALALVGCPMDSEPPQPGVWVDHAAPVGVEVTGSIGPVPHAALVRAVNAVGAAVPSDPVEVTVDGVALQVNIDGTGYGELALQVPGSFEVAGSGDPAQVHAVSSSWDGPGILPAQVRDLDATLAEPATGGALIAETHRVWWVDAAGAHPVLALPADVEGLRTAHLDADGVLDALAWSGDTLVLLKGRLGGGMSWAGTLEGDEGYTVGSASAGDMSSDGVADLVVGWAGASHDKLQILLGDGLWDFASTDPLFLAAAPQGLDIGDNTNDGRPQVTVTESGGDWERFIGTDAGGFLGTGPNLDLAFPDRSEVLSGFDLSGDGGDQLFIIAPWVEGMMRQAWVYDLEGNSPQYLKLDTPAARFSRADSDGDGLVDLWMLYEDGELVVLKTEESDYRQRRVATLSGHGPIATAGLLGDDATADVLVASPDAWTFWQGLVPQGEDTPWWEADEPRWGELALDLGGPLAMSGADLVGVEAVGGNLELHAWSVQPGPTLGDVATVRLGAYAEDARDLAVCDGIAWVLTPTDLVRVDLAGEAVTGRLDTTGTRVDCGDGPSGSAAALLDGAEARLLDEDLAQVGTVTVGGAADLAIVDLGTGPEVASCNTAPCRAERWVWGAGGEQALAVGTADGIDLLTGAGGVPLAGRGQVSVADVDGDGHLDLLAVADGVITVHRSTGEGIGPAEAWHATRDLEPPLVAADADGDGHPELWASSEGYLAWTP